MFITCPCHGWTYDLDGTLKRTPGSENLPGFDCQAIRLSEVRLETICGFVFVNPDPDALPTSSWYPGVEEELRAFVPGIDDLKPAEDVAVEEACNWKVSVGELQRVPPLQAAPPDVFHRRDRSRKLRH